MSNPAPLFTLALTLAFAAIFLFGGRLKYQPGQKGRRRFLSVAAGISVSYTFLHVLPTLGRMSDLTTVLPSGFQRLFPEYSAYLWAMAGFLIFYGLEKLVARPITGPESSAPEHHDEAAWRPWVHIGGFAVYAWLMTYLMAWTGKGPAALGLYGLAMGMHTFPIACHLSSEHGVGYDRRGAYLLAFAALAGWAAGLTVDLAKPIMVNLVAVVAGGVIINTAIAELPKEREGQFGYFLAGATVNTALLLILSHFEHGSAG